MAQVVLSERAFASAFANASSDFNKLFSKDATSPSVSEDCPNCPKSKTFMNIVLQMSHKVAFSFLEC